MPNVEKYINAVRFVLYGQHMTSNFMPMPNSYCYEIYVQSYSYQ